MPHLSLTIIYLPTNSAKNGRGFNDRDFIINILKVLSFCLLLFIKIIYYKIFLNTIF